MFKKIAIIGMGLMGGSLAAACRKRFPKTELIGISRSAEALAYARRQKWVLQTTRDLERGIQGADLIVLCVPVGQIEKYLKQVNAVAAPGALVTDVGSVKGELIRWAKTERLHRIQFVSSHPMAGSHRRGIQAATPELYRGSLTLVMTDSPGKRGLGRVKKFWTALGSKVTMLSSRVHDQAAAEISHLPHALAVSLMETVSLSSVPFAASGFRDTTRVAQGDSSIWLPIFFSNRKNLLTALKKFERSLKQLRNALQSNNPFRLRKILDDASQKRSQI